MKKRFLPIATAISAAALLAACSQTELIDDGSVKGNGTADNNAVTFSTYTAKNGGTRAGESENMTTAKLERTGFGVFAYSTGKLTYGQYQGTTYSGESGRESQDHYPNFMYNQKVEKGTDIKDEDNNVIYSNWTYTPLKYWPNDFSEGNVDQQNPPATGSSTYGGNVSFFAYAPYVSAGSGTTGITAISAANAPGDPIITYALGKDNTNGFVDLLWGTLNSAGNGAANQENKGLTHEKDATYTDGTHQKAILEGQTVAANLTKQTVNGQVDFLFKHALAGIGGNVVPEGPEDGTMPNNGFKVQLDIDDSADGSVTENKGITGGFREEFTIDNSSAKPAEKDKGTHYRTIVTIKNITITNTTGKFNVTQGEETKQAESIIYSGGKLNLATGKWTPTGSGSDYNFEHQVGTGLTDPTEANKSVAKLNPAIAELKSATESDMYFDKDNKLNYFKKGNNIDTDNDGTEDFAHTGVIETALNVYDDENVSPILLIPGSEPIFTITVEYIVRQYDDALHDKVTEVKNMITKNIIFPKVKFNTHYTLIMHLGLTSVKFTAEVSKWAENNSDDEEPGDENRTDGVIVNLDQINLPSNEVAPDPEE